MVRDAARELERISAEVDARGLSAVDSGAGGSDLASDGASRPWVEAQALRTAQATTVDARRHQERKKVPVETLAGLGVVLGLGHSERDALAFTGHAPCGGKAPH